MQPDVLRRRVILGVSASALSLSSAHGAIKADQGGLAQRSATMSIARIERQLGGRLGVAAHDLNSGQMIQHRSDQRFPLCSTFKLSLAGAVLEARDKGALSLDQKVHYGPADLLEYAPTTRAHLADGAMSLHDLCQAAVELSDNTAANLLLQAVGGPAGLTRRWRAWGDQQTRLDRTELALNSAIPGDLRDTTTPSAMLATLHGLILGDVLKPESSAELLLWMRQCQTGLTKLRSGFPAGVLIGDKTGNNGKDTMGDLAIAEPMGRRPILVVCYITEARVRADEQSAAIAAVGRVVSQAFLSASAEPQQAEVGLARPQISAMPSMQDARGWLLRGEVAMALGVIGIILLLLLPIPAVLIDLLLALSLTAAVLILMTSLLIKKPLEFTAFPTVLLASTLFRLGLDLASTRLI